MGGCLCGKRCWKAYVTESKSTGTTLDNTLRYLLQRVQGTVWARLRLNAAHFRGSRKPVQGLRPTRQRWGTQGREAVPTLLEAQFPSASVQQVLAFLRPREGSKSWNMDSLGKGPQDGQWQTCLGDQKSPRFGGNRSKGFFSRP